MRFSAHRCHWSLTGLSRFHVACRTGAVVFAVLWMVWPGAVRAGDQPAINYTRDRSAFTSSLIPVISVSPDSLLDSLFTGEISTHTITISNNGSTDLTFSLSIDATAAPVARSASASAPSLDVALLAADESSFVADVRNHLLATGRFGSVTVIDAIVLTPTLAELLAFDALLVWNNYSYANPDALGDTLASFVDAGGAVVCAVFEVSGGETLRGRWQSEQYFAIERSDLRCCTFASMGVVANPSHPILAGVVSFDGGYGSYRPSTSDLTAGSILLASWSDGMPLVVTKTKGRARRVDLGFFPPSSDLYQDFWQVGTDGDLLMANSLEWAASVWIAAEPDQGTIPAGGSLDVTVTLDASRRMGGDYLAEIRVSSDDPVSPEVIVAAHLNITDAPDIHLSDTLLDYGNTFTGTVATSMLLIFNEGTQPLTLNSPSLTPSDYSSTTTGFSIDPGEFGEVAVSFAPGTAGVFNGSLLLTSDDPDEPALHVTLTGTGLDPPVVSLAPDSLDDSLLSGEVSTHVLTVSNTGLSDLIFDIAFDRIASPAAVLTLAEAASSLLSRSAEAERLAGPMTAQARRHSPKHPMDSDAPFGMLHSATAQPTGPDVVLLGADDLSAVSDVQSFLLATGRIGSVTALDVRFVTPTVAQLQAFDAALVWNNYSFANRVALGDTLAKYVDAGGGVVCAVFETSGNGGLGGRWASEEYYVIERSDPRCCDNATLGPVVLPLHPILDGVESFQGGYLSYRPNTSSLTSGSLLIASWSDGMPLVATKSQGEALRVDLGFYPPSSDLNSGLWQAGTDGDMLLANALVWVSVPWLAAEPASGVVPAGSDLDVTISMNASGLFGGDYLANIQVFTNDPVSPEVVVPTHLYVTGVPDIALSDTLFDFGTQFVGATTTDTLVVVNAGTALLSLTTQLSAPPDFSFGTTEFDLEPGELHDLEVTFEPGTIGSFSGSLIIASNDPDEPAMYVSLAGAGEPAPVLSLSSEVLVDSLFVGESSTQVLTIANHGGSDLVFDLSVQKLADVESITQSAPAIVRPHVALVTTSSDYYAQDVQSLLEATGQFESVTSINVMLRTPTLTELLAYDALLVWGDNFYANRTALGDRLADYVDAGGGVVCALVEVAGSSFNQLSGRWATESYQVIGRGGAQTGTFASLGEVEDPRHPLLAGVRSFDGGNGSIRPQTTALTSGSYLVASWSDGKPLVAAREMALTRRVDLGMFPPSSRVRFDGWQVLSDGDLLLANALTWVSGSWIEAAPAFGTVPAGGTLDLAISFDADRLATGDHGAQLIISSNDPILDQVALQTHLFVFAAQVGDCNGDLVVNGQDVIHLVNYVFKSGAAPRGQTGDYSCEYAVTVMDVIHLVHHVFKGEVLDDCR